MDYHRLNQQLFRKYYLLPIIGETMQKLEGFHYATSLYLYMGYYTINLSPASQHRITIVNEFLKLGYNHLPILMCALWDILQAKLDEIISYNEGVQTYIDDISVLGK